MMELLSPAGSFEAAVAAVQSGADAIYLGYGSFNARRNAANFDENGLRRTVNYCHLRGVKVHLTMNTLLSDAELPKAAEVVRLCNEIGVDALIVQDLGVVEMIHRVAPKLPIHASTQMTVHNLDGVLACAAMGIERVVLSRELSKEQIRYICRHSPIEIEVFVHGALCMCYSGQCFLSSVIGGRSGNRGLCAQPCRLKYGWDGTADGNPLSLKDLSLVKYLTELEDMGVACAKIEGRMKRPEYVAVVTRIYSSVLRERRMPTQKELEELKAAFSRQGFTEGYYHNKTGRAMFGVREKENNPDKLFAQARQDYNREHPRVPVDCELRIVAGEPMFLRMSDDEGHSVEGEGAMPQEAMYRSVTREQAAQQLQRTGGTPFYVRELEVELEEGLSVPLSALNSLRRKLLDELGLARIQPPKRPEGELGTIPKAHNRTEAPVYTVSLRTADQFTEELIRLHPEVIYLPAEAILAKASLVEKAMEEGVEIDVELPRITWDSERAELVEQLEQVKELGIYTALVGDLGACALAVSLDFTCRGNFGIGTYNSMTLGQLREMDFLSATASFEQRMARVRDLNKVIDTELIVYGRLPLMITQNCIIHNRNQRCNCQSTNILTDRTGARFPVLKARGCRNEIFNSKKLYLADKQDSYRNLGLWAARLNFTTENARECIQTLKLYQGSDPNYTPMDITRGLYFRDVE